MDTSDSEISFDKNGICNHCHDFDKAAKLYLFSEEEKALKLPAILEKIKKEGKGKEYDCVIGLSGGVDSSYLAHKVKEFGLRPLAIHLDNGWNSELAVKNIENIVKKLNIDLFTYVIDWEEFKDLQLAFLKASVVDIEMLTDGAILVAIDRIAREHNISYFLTGNNFATENVMPASWYYSLKHDSLNIKTIHKQFGKIKALKSYPFFNFFDFWRYTYFNKIKTVPLLNFLDYQKSAAMQLLIDQYNWKDYGGKHWESKFTQFYQIYILPEKYGIDKRRAHLSSLILTNQMSREKALELISEEIYDKGKLRDDIVYMLKKFDLSEEEFKAIMEQPPVLHTNYASYGQMKSRLGKLKRAVLSKK